MRMLATAMLFLAIPAFATAQQSTDALEAAPVVELQQSTAPSSLNAPAAVDGVSAEAPAPDVQLESQSSQADQPAAMQDPATRQWWYLVGAIVVGGLILAILL
jgi:hypothetical protein